MQITKRIGSVLAIFFILSTGFGFARAHNLYGVKDFGVSDHVAPQAPRVTCNIYMQFWCIVQGDSIVNMSDDGSYRTWSISSSKENLPSVIIRENKLCDSTDEFHAKKISEAEHLNTRKQRRHIIEYSLTADGACTLRVEYPVGNGERAREAQRLAQYRLYACKDRSCNIALLSIK